VRTYSCLDKPAVSAHALVLPLRERPPGASAPPSLPRLAPGALGRRSSRSCCRCSQRRRRCCQRSCARFRGRCLGTLRRGVCTKRCLGFPVVPVPALGLQPPGPPSAVSPPASRFVAALATPTASIEGSSLPPWTGLQGGTVAAPPAAPPPKEAGHRRPLTLSLSVLSSSEGARASRPSPSEPSSGRSASSLPPSRPQVLPGMPALRCHLTLQFRSQGACQPRERRVCKVLLRKQGHGKGSRAPKSRETSPVSSRWRKAHEAGEAW